MTKDMLGSVVRAAVGVPQSHLDTLAKIASKFGITHPLERPEGRVWHAYFEKVLKEGLPNSAYLLDVRAFEIGIGEFVVNYDQTVVEKLREECPLIQSGRFLSHSRQLSIDVFRPAERTGTVRYKASAVAFSAFLPRRAIAEWAYLNKKTIAGTKEGIDIVAAIPQLKLDRILPLVMFGERMYDHQEFSYAPYFGVMNDRLHLDFQPFDEGATPTLWSTKWKFLMLEELSPTT